MADFTFNIAKGKVGGYYDRVKNGDPADSRLVAALFNVTGGVAAEDAALIDADTFAAIEALANVAEITNSGYARQYITAAQLAASAPDDTNNRFDLDIPDLTFAAVVAGTAVMKLVIGYIPDGNSTGGVTSPSAMIAHGPNKIGGSWLLLFLRRSLFYPVHIFIQIVGEPNIESMVNGFNDLDDVWQGMPFTLDPAPGAEGQQNDQDDIGAEFRRFVEGTMQAAVWQSLGPIQLFELWGSFCRIRSFVPGA